MGTHLMNEVLPIAAEGVALALLKDADHQALVVEYNATAAPYPSDRTIIDLFRDQVTRSPDAEAIRLGDATLTYRQLDERSNQMATHLSSTGVGPGRIAVVFMEHSIEVVVAILGVLKSGAAYVPLDAATPKGRIATILKDISNGTDGRPPVAITQARLQSVISSNLADIFVLDADFGSILNQPDSARPSAATSDVTAYIIFTSGSTGTPKGVEIEHRSLVNYIWWAARVYSSGERLTWPLFSSLAFDLTVTTLFTPLITGGRIVVYLGDPGVQSMVVLKVIDDNAVDIMKLTPAHLAMIRDRNLETTRLRKFIVGGEDFKTELARDITKAIPHPIEIYNEYGPTEATVGCMIHRFDIDRDQSASVPIGVPAANAGIYILSKAYHPTGPGIIGEMFIAGDGLARGYFNRPDLTDERFRTAADPRGGSSNLRLYKTGDLARWNSQGRLEFLGRADHQVKVGGTRIELGEIEARLLRHPHVQECAVAAIAASVAKPATQIMAQIGYVEPPAAEDGIARLVAYYVSSKPPTVTDLRAHLAEELLESMIPTHFVRLERMPLTSNGKIDRSSLPEPTAENIQPAQDFTAPSTETEKTLAALWCDLLKIKSIGRRDNFFDLGGHSLLVIRAVSRVRKTFGVDVQLRNLFERPTVAELAEVIDGMRSVADTPSVSEQSKEEILQFHARGDRPPLYFFNGDLISGHLTVRRMAEVFGPDYPIISIDPHGLRGEQIPPSIEEMAADRLPLILERQASGPFLLGGKCNGAVVAFEAARLLMAAGHKVDLVAMVDPPTINARPVTRAIIRLMRPLVSPYRLRWTYQLLVQLEIFFKASTSKKITKLLKRLRIGKLHDGLSNPDVDIPPALWDVYSLAMAQYLPAPLEAPVSFYAAGSNGRAWRLSSQLEVIEVPGEHSDTLASGADLLVDHLRQRIDLLTDGAARSMNRTRPPTPAETQGLWKGTSSPSRQPIVGRHAIEQRPGTVDF
jgi:amino acid adenylation domain-containing protein